MKNLFLLGIFSSALYLTCYGEELASPTKEIAQVGIDVEVGGDDYDDDGMLWIGPGWYYGVWFDNEVEYNDWHDHHHYHHDHDHHNHHDHHDHGLHGGDHHGGHHGGHGGHGGGHHK